MLTTAHEDHEESTVCGRERRNGSQGYSLQVVSKRAKERDRKGKSGSDQQEGEGIDRKGCSDMNFFIVHA